MRTSLEARGSIKARSKRRNTTRKALMKREDLHCEISARRLNVMWSIPSESYPSMDSFLNTLVQCGHMTGLQAKHIGEANRTRSMTQEEKIREASKPLHLKRYE